jgi:hypothetical protein
MFDPRKLAISGADRACLWLQSMNVRGFHDALRGS